MIRAEGLVKEFSRPERVQGRFSGVRSFFSTKKVVTRAVDDVSLTIDDGELVGYLGPNGAGKSTTIKMLTGILVPTAGHVEVEGIVPWQDRRANARNIGAVFGQRSQLWIDLPLRDSFDLIAKLYGLHPVDYRRSLDAFVDLLNMGPLLDTAVRSLSLGQRMRGDIVAAMLYRPPVLYLDEPTVGLDVVAKARIRDFIAEQNRSEGTTVLLTTHDISDIEQLARRVVIIDEGRILYDGDLQRLKARYARVPRDRRHRNGSACRTPHRRSRPAQRSTSR
ncbi:ATP-binding cassette domain-containing protein [Nakamurella aerolata]|uniref:ATP-binding cassette domain-containing protein n=1 Tax=Nakamurella aerolata TaxID=1656892 RepID=A0A849A4X0_9ACTN|nr:ATP-binding cassette domain-containing protein [Nakamurella aerolata]